jgi:hypothetical protein
MRTGRGPSTIGLVTAAVLLLSGGGCSGLPSFNSAAAKIPKFQVADAKHPASEILAIWQPGEGPGRNGVPTRGIAGQLFFFGQSVAAPLVVTGNVRIYLFDNRGSVGEQSRPIQEYTMSPVVLNGHLQFCSLGPMYEIFLPYPRDDYHEAMCSLRLKFTPTEGETIYSTQSTVTLPGPPLQADASRPAGSIKVSSAVASRVQPLPWQSAVPQPAGAQSVSSGQLALTAGIPAAPQSNPFTKAGQSGSSQPYVFVPDASTAEAGLAENRRATVAAAATSASRDDD